MMKYILEKFNPKVDKKVLYFLAGLTWSMVGIMLIKKAFPWLFYNIVLSSYIFLFIGIVIGIIIAIFGFSKVANKNIKRIKKFQTKKCIFGFVSWKSYILITFMVALGITLRNSQLPKIYLSVVYNAIGVALFLASFRYFKEIF